MQGLNYPSHTTNASFISPFLHQFLDDAEERSFQETFSYLKTRIMMGLLIVGLLISNLLFFTGLAEGKTLGLEISALIVILFLLLFAVASLKKKVNIPRMVVVIFLWLFLTIFLLSIWTLGFPSYSKESLSYLSLGIGYHIIY